MRIIHYDDPGPPDVLKVVESDLPFPKDSEILVEIFASGINRPDLLQREGNYPSPPGHSKILGLEASGIVKKIGKKVKDFKIGDKVCSLLDGGGYAEYCIANPQQTFKIPKNCSFEEAAGIPECFITCWSNLVVRGKLKKNQNVLIHGGSSGIGTTAIQILKLFNSNIFTTVGNDKKKKFCEKLGAHMAINYNKNDFYDVLRKEKIKGIDIILDMVGGDYIQKNINLLNNEGKLINIAYQKGSKIELNLIKVMLKRLTLTGSTLRIRSKNFKKQIIKSLNKFVLPKIEDGTIKPIIDSVYKLENANLAHKYIYKNKHIGKIILSAK